VLLVSSHPLEEGLVAAVRERAVDALMANGHDVDLLHLDTEGFDPCVTADEWRVVTAGGSSAPLPADVAAHARRLQRAEALVLVYPTWWGAQPAIMKGWLERVWVDGVAYARPEGSRRTRPLLRDIRRLVAITTHGSPKWINAVEGEPGKRIVLRQMRSCCHPLVRTRWLALYGVDRADDARCRAFLDKVTRAMSRL
jgi:putative NADPH-quinone reductase